MNHNIPDEEPARFALYRHDDVHGVSGEGVVAYGIRWPNSLGASVVYRWTSSPRTTQRADKIKHVRQIHGHGDKTVVLWLDEPPIEATDQSDIFLEGTNPKAGGEA